MCCGKKTNTQKYTLTHQLSHDMEKSDKHKKSDNTTFISFSKNPLVTFQLIKYWIVLPPLCAFTLLFKLRLLTKYFDI